MKRRTFIGGALSAMAAVPPVRVDGDGMLVVNNQRTFLLGLYQLPQGPDAWKRAAEVGFHVVHLDAKRDQIEEARARGMYGWITVGSKAKAEDEARIRKLVSDLK